MPLGKVKILIVDDDTIARTGIKNSLCGENIYIAEASDGMEALKMAGEVYFDLIFSDISMPKMSGIELLAALRDLGCRSKVVLCTGYGDKETAIQALRLGAFDYLEKPVQGHALKAIVERSLLTHKKNKLLRLTSTSYSLKSIDFIIVEYLMSGLSNKEIGDKIHLTEQSIKYHFGKLFKSFGVKNRGQLRTKILEVLN